VAQGKRIYLGVYLFINLDTVTWRLNAEYRGDPAFLAKAWKWKGGGVPKKKIWTAPAVKKII